MPSLALKYPKTFQKAQSSDVNIPLGKKKITHSILSISIGPELGVSSHIFFGILMITLFECTNVQALSY